MTFIPNRNFEKELQADSRYVQGLKEVAQPAKTAARSIAAAEAYDEGDYHDSIDVVNIGDDVYLRATDFKAWWIEMGSIHNDPSAPLSRGVREAGFDFR